MQDENSLYEHSLQWNICEAGLQLAFSMVVLFTALED